MGLQQIASLNLMRGPYAKSVPSQYLLLAVGGAGGPTSSSQGGAPANAGAPLRTPIGGPPQRDAVKGEGAPISPVEADALSLLLYLTCKIKGFGFRV